MGRRFVSYLRVSTSKQGALPLWRGHRMVVRSEALVSGPD
jgi:hypothetical protein